MKNIQTHDKLIHAQTPATITYLTRITVLHSLFQPPTVELDADTESPGKEIPLVKKSSQQL